MIARLAIKSLLEAAPTLRRLSRREAEEAGHDAAEMREFPIKRLEVEGSQLDFEEGPETLWILNVQTEPYFRKQGKASQLLRELYSYAQRGGKKIVHGTFTDEGEAYLRPVVRRLER